MRERNYTLIGMMIIVSLVGVAYLYTQLLIAPSQFPVNKNFVIEENESLRSISDRLQTEGYIKSALIFRAGLSFFDRDRKIQLGGYVFDTPQSFLGVIARFIDGRPTTPVLSVTVPEGSTTSEVAALVAKALPSSSVSKFNTLITTYNANGKLFPSTYFLLPSYTEDDIIKLMVSTFTKKVQDVLIPSEISPPLNGVNDVLILASILEGEAKTEVDMKIVAGILIERLRLGMPLQVDVAKETYKEKGLPKTPINNPGLIAIIAVLHPTSTEYLYYITGNDGKMYYAKTFEEHKKNIKKYLK